MGSRKVPESIFLPSPADPQGRTLNQAIIDLYRILARKLNEEIVQFTFNPGSFDITDGEGVIMTYQLKIVGDDQIRIVGDSQLRIT